MYGSLPLQSSSSSLHKLYRRRVIHPHLHFGHSCSFEELSRGKFKKKPTDKYKEKGKKAPTYNTFLGWWWNDEALERLLDRQLLKQTQEVAVAPPHREGFALKHLQGRLKEETATAR